MNEKNKNLLARVISALVLLPVVLWLFWRGGYWTAGLLAVTAAVCASEYFTIVGKTLGPAQWVGMAAAALFPILPPWLGVGFPAGAFWTVLAVFFFAWIFHLIKGPLPEAPTRAAHLITGVLYAGLGLAALAATRLLDHGFAWVVCALVITWGNDTSAYFAGRFLGRHKLYPAVSPNKTWEGFVGGLCGSVLGLFIMRWFFFPQLPVSACFLVGTLGGLLGPLGDLCESMLKRAYQVKDSGTLLPGHGGFLDRIDALLFNAPLVFLYAISLGRGL